MKLCPICGKVLDDKDKLIVIYYPTMNWWVTHHLIEIDDSNHLDYSRFVFQGKHYKEFCAQADINKVT